jgi:hypothetical protein
VKDITRETLAIILEENPRGVLCDPDEASGWVASFNEYKGKGGSDRQFWLSNWSCQPVSVDRKGGRESHYVPYPFISVLGGLPPSMLGCFSEERGRDDGFEDRILFVFPDDHAFPRQRWTEAELSEETARVWTEVVERLYSTPMVRDQEKEVDRPLLVEFTPEAKAAWVEWFDSHADQTDDPVFPEGQAGAWSKLRAYAARFVLILSRLRLACDPTATDHPGPISVEDVRGAVALVDYFKGHLTRVRHEITGGVFSADAKGVLEWITRNRKATFRLADVSADLRRFREDPQRLEKALKALEAAGAIRPRPEHHERGRHPSQSYEVHPDLLRAPENPENPENGAPPPVARDDSGILGNSRQTQLENSAETDRETFEL